MTVDQHEASRAPDGLAPADKARQASSRVVALFLLGTVLAQAAWIFALPPFRGTDEFNHAFRAASVARGDWAPHDPAKHGRGDLVRVPRDLVQAAHAQCASLPYTMHDDCNAVRTVGHGQVLVATSASRYNPAYYAIVGTAALPFHGTTALYAMRIVSSLLCSLFLSLAVWSLTLWARSWWPFLAFLVAMTPVAIFSTIVVAPNGLEFCSALAIWCALVGLTRAPNPRTERRLIYAAIPAGIVLAVVRPLGPGFLCLALITAWLATGPRSFASVVGRNLRACGILSVLCAIAIGANALWLWSANLSQVSLHGHNPDPLISSLRLAPAQFLQLFAAFPYRDVPAPTIVYATTLLVAAIALGVGLRASQGSLRIVIIAAALATFAGPFLFTLVTYVSKGSFWQGRYGLPFVVGVPLLIGFALDRRPPIHRLGAPVVVTILALLSVAHAVSPINVMLLEFRRSASIHDPHWVHPAVWGVGALIVLAWASYLLGLLRAASLGPTTGIMQTPNVQKR